MHRLAKPTDVSISTFVGCKLLVSLLTQMKFVVAKQIQGDMETTAEDQDNRGALAPVIDVVKILVGNLQIITQVRKTPSWPRSWANFSLL
jgi:hypothetical protein